MTEITLRAAGARNAREVAILHVAVWRQTYRDLALENAFVTLDESYRFEKWNEKLSVPEADQLVLVAEKENRLVGIGAAGAPSEETFGGRGEIKFLYIDPDFKR